MACMHLLRDEADPLPAVNDAVSVGVQRGADDLLAEARGEGLHLELVQVGMDVAHLQGGEQGGSRVG